MQDVFFAKRYSMIEDTELAILNTAPANSKEDNVIYNRKEMTRNRFHNISHGYC